MRRTKTKSTTEFRSSEHAESISDYVGNVSAEMATVLRKDANILIRLREKMECIFALFFIRLAIQSS